MGEPRYLLCTAPAKKKQKKKTLTALSTIRKFLVFLQSGLKQLQFFLCFFFHLRFIALCNSLPSHLNWLPSGRISYISKLEHGWFFCDASVSWNWTCCLFFCSGFCFFLKELDRKLKNQKSLFEIICRIKLFSFIRSAHDMKLYIKFREILPSLIFPCTKNKSKWATHAFSYETDKTYSRVTYKCLFSLKAEPFS